MSYNIQGSKVFFLSNTQATLELGEELSSPNVHDVAGILKQYLRELPSPLILPSLHPTLEGVWSRGEGRERVELVMCALLQLPRQHLQVRNTSLYSLLLTMIYG